MKKLALALTLTTMSFSVFAWDSEERYGNPYGNDRNSTKIYSSDGEYRGNLNDNEFDPNSVSNPYGKYGNEFSPKSINNPFYTD